MKSRLSNNPNVLTCDVSFINHQNHHHMKKQLFTLVSAWMFCTVSVKAQITLDFTVDSTIYGYYFYPTKISDNETKYVFLDTTTNSFSLYNLDMTPFLIDISVPHQIFNSDGTGGGFFYHIMYITRSLFDCDSSTIEYLYSAQDEPYQPLWIIRTDGTVLLHADSSRGPYCLGCPGGTTLQRPILNTENGAKLFIMKHPIPGYSINHISVYSLCGSLPNAYDFRLDLAANYVELFPNPSSMQLNFNVTLPDNLNEYSLIIFDSHAHQLTNEKLGNSRMFSVDVRQYDSGTYYYSFASKDNVIQSGKFQIIR